MELKVPGIDLFSAGNIGKGKDADELDSIKAVDEAHHNYEHVFINKKMDEIVGVILYGDTADINKDFLMIEKHKKVNDLITFSVLVKKGAAADGDSSMVADMDDSDIVCGCNDITKGES